jgi:hypothetical protein
MEKGFFHPDRGYWQTNSDPAKSVLDTYPEGTFEVPIKPGADYEWDGSTWVHSEPTPEPVPMSMSFAQLMIGLVAEQWITEEEGRLWLTGTLPPQVVSTINLIPEEQRFAATAKATRPSVVDRMDPLVQRMALVQKRSAAEVDDFFRTYASA